jgi:hypothetical protein
MGSVTNLTLGSTSQLLRHLKSTLEYIKIPIPSTATAKADPWKISQQKFLMKDALVADVAFKVGKDMRCSIIKLKKGNLQGLKNFKSE